MSDLKDFIRQVEEDRAALLASTNTDDEVLYLMIGSLGRISSLFAKGDYTNPAILEHSVAVAAAASIIGLPEDGIQPEEIRLSDKSETDRPRGNHVKFFIYKHDSDGMKKALSNWIDEHGLTYDRAKITGVDKNGRHMVGLFRQEEGAVAFILSADEITCMSVYKYLSKGSQPY